MCNIIKSISIAIIFYKKSIELSVKASGVRGYVFGQRRAEDVGREKREGVCDIGSEVVV